MSRSFFSRCVLWLLVLLALAGGTAAVAVSPTTGDLGGTVTDARGKGLANAFVQITGGPELGTARTDSAGKYLFTDLEPGLYDVLARKQGYVSVRRSRLEIAATTTKQQSFELEWADTNSGGIEATITGPQNTLLPNATVDLVRNGASQARAVTDERGVAIFTGLARGAYRLQASRPGYFPAASRNVTVRLRQLTATALKLRVDPSQAGSVSGTIEAANGTSIRNATVRVISSFTGTVEVAARGGRYSVEGLVPGDRYRVEAAAEGFATQTQSNVVITANSNTIVNMVLQPNVPNRGSLIGLVENSNGQPLPFATVTLTTGPDILRAVQTDTEGRYAFPDLRPTTGLSVRVEQEGFYPAGASGLTIAVGRTVTANFRLRSITANAGEIRGRVREEGSGRPLANVVISITEGASAGLTTVTDGSGVYLLDGLQPGGGYTVTFTRTDFAALVRSQLVVPIGAQLVVNADLSPRQASSGVLTGSVKRSGNIPVKGVTVSLTAGASSPLEATTDSKGVYTFGSLQPGSGYALRFEKQRFAPKEVADVTIVDGQTRRVDVVLTRKNQVGALGGRVLDLAQRPIADGFARILAGPELAGTVRTNERGEFIFEALLAGTYTIEVGANGYRTEQRGNITVSPQRTTRLTFTLLR